MTPTQITQRITKPMTIGRLTNTLGVGSTVGDTVGLPLGLRLEIIDGASVGEMAAVGASDTTHIWHASGHA